MRYCRTFGFGLFLLLLLAACGEEAKEHIAPAVHDRDSASMMTSYGVNTLISDSGVIKYRIVTERWDVNVIRQPNRWEFMKGVFFEQFDEQFHVQAYIQADTAWYYDQLKLFWDGLRHEFYSNVFSNVVTPERTLQGTYFRSNERMTHYTVSNSKGSFIPGEEGDDSSSTPGDTLNQQPQAPMRPAARKHAMPPKNDVQP